MRIKNILLKRVIDIMANKNWDEILVPGDCVGDNTPTQWNAMVQYIKHNGSCNAGAGHILYDNDASVVEWFKFYEHSIDFKSKRAIYINDDEVFIGHDAGNPTVSGIGNTCIGSNSGSNITTGYGNIGIGYQALWKTNIGYYNVAIGYGALRKNTTGIGNTGIGYYSLSKNVAGNYNTAVGRQALEKNTTGSFCVAFGYRTLEDNTTGSSNTGVGYNVLQANISGRYNVAMGHAALKINTTGDANTGYGYRALEDNITGLGNTGIGFNTGENCATDIDKCIYIGYKAGSNNAVSNRLYISNSDSAFPLIYGEFNNNIVKFGNSNDTFFFKFSHDANDAIVETEANNRSLYLKPHGTGLVKFGTYAATGDVVCNGNIAIEDENGNSRKLMTCA